MQAIATDAAAAAVVCHVSDSASDQCAPHQQGPACLAVLLSPASVHRRPLYQLPCLRMVSVASCSCYLCV